MTLKTKTCQNCQQNFRIEPEDFAFYEKIHVPAPTFCPECRAVRRMVFRNERVWYRHPCDATGKQILSMFPPGNPYKVYDFKFWWGDGWDPLGWGRDYDFSRDFFSQFKELFLVVPHPNLIQKNNINSDYSNHTLNLKNCYFAASCDTNEDGAYLFGRILNTKDCLDLHQTNNSELTYDSVDSWGLNKTRFGQNSGNCVDSWFLYDCLNCTSCAGCVGLRGKQYHLLNQPYSKEDYFIKLEKLDLGNYKNLQKFKEDFKKLKLKTPRKYANIVKSENVLGDDIRNSRNCQYCFYARDDIENVKYGMCIMKNTKDGYDAYIAWNGAEVFYDSQSISGQNILFSLYVWGGFDVQYSYNCFDCHHIFGCVGLRNKSYCILNKQYSKEEYQELVPKIIQNMKEMPFLDSRGRKYFYGELFPTEFSPFAYNETVTQDYYSLTKEEAMATGYSWRDPEAKNYSITKKAEDLPDNIKDVSDSILQEVISCEHAGKCNENCATAFKIIPMELNFYRKMGLPLPRLCPSCRHYQRLKLKNPVRLWHRSCQCAGAQSENGIYKNMAPHPHINSHCPNEFESPYSPERAEIVYCEQCYQNEVV